MGCFGENGGVKLLLVYDNENEGRWSGEVEEGRGIWELGESLRGPIMMVCKLISEVHDACIIICIIYFQEEP